MGNGRGALAMRAAEVPATLLDQVHIERGSGELVIAEGSETDARVLGFESRLRKMGLVRRRRVVPYAEFLEARRGGAEEQGAGGQPAHTRTRMLDDAMALFRDACAARASDVHIREHGAYADVLYRVNGSLVQRTQWKGEYARALCSTIYAAMADIADPVYNPGEYQDARIASEEILPRGLHGIRVASAPKVGGAVMVLRLLYDQTAGAAAGPLEPRLSGLGYVDAHLRAVRAMQARPTGINVIAGPTGSGKSTTLKHVMEAMVHERADLNIITVEDPPEYPIRGVVQMPVTNARGDEGRGAAFGAAIRAAMRMDPDVIMVGEVRDQESAHLALRAAMTGHQVWTTVHANSAFGIVTRMADILAGPELSNPVEMMADVTVLTGLVYQRLVKTLCAECKTPLAGRGGRARERLDPGLLARIDYLFGEGSEVVHVRGAGCDACGASGVAGRTVLSEVVATDADMLAVLREEGVEAARAYYLEQCAGLTVLDHAIMQIGAGLVDPAMAEAVVGPVASSPGAGAGPQGGGEETRVVEWRRRKDAAGGA